MSSVGSADNRNSQHEQVSRLREDYKSAEEKREDRHRAELKRVSEIHQRDLESMKAQHRKHVEDLKSNTRRLLDEKDQSYHKDISEMQKLNRQHLQRTLLESQTRDDVTRRTHGAQLEQTKEVAEQQRSSLKDGYDGEIERKESEFSKQINDTQEKMQTERVRHREQMDEKHREETDAMREDRNRLAKESDRDYRQMVQSKDRKFNETKNHLENQLKDTREGYAMRAQNDVESHYKSLQLNHEGYKESLAEMRDRYNEIIEQEKVGTGQHRMDLEDRVTERTNDQLRQREDKIQKLDHELVHQGEETKRLNQTEKLHMMNDHEKALDLYRQQKDEAVGQFNEMMTRENRRTQQKHDKLMGDTNKFYKDRIDLETVKNAEHMTQKQTEHEAAVEHLKRTETERSSRLTANYNDDREKLADFHLESVDDMKRTNDEKLKEQRLNNLQERNIMFTNANRQMRERDAQFEDRLNFQREAYQKQLGEMQRQQKDEIKQLRAQTEKRVMEGKKGTDMQLQNQEVQFESRLKQVEERHLKDKDTLERRHQAQVNQLVEGLRASKV